MDDARNEAGDDTTTPAFVATDPVVTRHDGEIAVLGGLTPTSMDD
jgi:hypothetical protein